TRHLSPVLLDYTWRPPRPTLFPYTTLFRSPSVWFAQPPASHPLEVPQVRVPDPLIVADSAEALGGVRVSGVVEDGTEGPLVYDRSEEHTSELQSRERLVCRLLLATKRFMPV